MKKNLIIFTVILLALSSFVFAGRGLDCNVDNCTDLVSLWDFDDSVSDYSDDFTGTTLDTSIWTEWGSSVTVNGELILETPATAWSSSGVDSAGKMMVSDDFEFTVDVDMANQATPSSGVATGVVTLIADSGTYYRASLNKASNGNCQYTTYSTTGGFGDSGIVSCTGGIKFKRVGSTLAASYWTGSAWSQFTSTTSVTDPFRIQLVAQPTGDVVNHAEFDNFVMVSGFSADDSSSNTNLGKVYGASWATGTFDGALSFDGSDYVTVSEDIDDSFDTTGFSISLWVKPSSIGSTQTFVSHYAGNSEMKGYELRLSGGNAIAFYLYGGVAGSSYGVKTADSVIVQDEWQHMVVVWNDSISADGFDIYLDGVLLGTTVSSGGAAVSDYLPTTDTMHLGRTVWGSGPGAYYLGLMDDVSIWSGDLSSSEVLTLYSQGVGCVDIDGDGFGAVGSSLSECNYTVDYDCDDTDSAINPLAIDIPNNAVDEDCSGADATANYDATVLFTYDYNVDGFWGYHVGDDIGYDVTFEKDSSAHEDDVTGVVVNLTDVEGNVLLSHDLLDMTDTGTGSWSGIFDTTELTSLLDDKINMRVYVYGAGGLLDWAPHQDQVWITGTPAIDSFNVGSFTVVTDAPSNVTVRDLAVSLGSFGKINFSRGLGEGLDFSSRVIDCSDAFVMGDQFMTVVSEDYPELNTSAVVSLENVACPIERSQLIYYPGFSVTKAGIQAGGLTCPEGICSDISCVGSTLTFTVEHFSGYAYGASSNLTISDSAEGSYVENDTRAIFYAYYINATDGSAITGATCTVDFDDGSGSQAMSYDTDHYEYTKTAGFASAATHDWNVSCSKTGYTSLFAEDTISVQAPAGSQAGVPEFSTWTLLIGLMVIIGGFFAVKQQE